MSPGCEDANKKIIIIIIRCSRPRLVSSEHSTKTLQPLEVVAQMKHLKRIFFCLLSHIFPKKKKKSFETQEISGFSSRRSERGWGLGFLGGIHSLSSSFLQKKEPALTFFFFLPVVNSLQALWLPPPAIWQIHRATQHFWCDECCVTPEDAAHTRSPQVPTRKGVFQRSSPTQKIKK